MDPQGRVALVTGAGGGIGRELAGALHQSGAALFLVDLNEAPLLEFSRKLGSDRTACFAGNVASANTARQAAQSCIEAFGKIDILVNVAGIFGKVQPSATLPEDEWDRVLDINLKGAFLFCQAVIPGMIERRRGRIVNISSGIARRGYAGAAPYSASKAGIIGLSRALALELAAHGITVNVVAPGLVDTPLPRSVSSEEDLARRASTNPMGRIGVPGDVANAVLFFLKDESNYITGQVLYVNGGGI
jgi:3-oxoacyl-[acyl-carrier protein] reductase